MAANNTRLFDIRTRFNPVANIKSARKRARTAEKTRKHNMGLRSTMRTSIKKVIKACDAGDKDAATAALRAAQPELMRGVTKGVYHKNTASRKMSRLAARVKALA